MKKHSRLFLKCCFAAILFSTASLLVGCSPSALIRSLIGRQRASQTSEESAGQETKRQASSLQPKRPGEILKPTSPFYSIIGEITSDLERNDFAAIDAKADKARKNKERLSGGYWKIKGIYDGLADIYGKELVTDEIWQNRIAKLQKWKQQFPKSITARVALGEAYLKYAWFARGTGFSNTVSREVWNVVDKRLD